MLLVSDQPHETMLLGHLLETPVTIVSNADKQVTMPEIAPVIAVKDKLKQTLSISMMNMIPMKDLKPRTGLMTSNNSLMPCLLTRKQNWQRKWESLRIFPQLD